MAYDGKCATKVMDELQNLKRKLKEDFKVPSIFLEVLDDAYEFIKVVPEGGINSYEAFKQCWINEGYDPSYKFENNLSMREYYKVIEILNEASIRVVEETNNNVDLFDMEDKTTYVLGNLTDANITKEQAELLEKVGINKITVVNRE